MIEGLETSSLIQNYCYDSLLTVVTVGVLRALDSTVLDREEFSASRKSKVDAFLRQNHMLETENVKSLISNLALLNHRWYVYETTTTLNYL